VQDREAEEWKSERKGGREAETGLFKTEGNEGIKAKLTGKGKSQVRLLQNKNIQHQGFACGHPPYY
jgi:hypothetical protein